VNEALGNKIWWFIYDEVGVHPDDHDIDFSTPGSVEDSLKSEGLGDWEVPRVATPDLTWGEFCIEVAKNSILVDKGLAEYCAKRNPRVKALWKDCTPPDAPEIDNEVLAFATMGRSVSVV
jgi:hypothetical protein